MRVLVEGSGGAAGWPQPGCRCASCLRKKTDAFLDLLGEPAQLGLLRLRARGLITADTVTAVAFADHRVSPDRASRCRPGDRRTGRAAAPGTRTVTVW